MGRQRPIEPFHRPYVPPEPPAPSRGPKRFALPVAAAVLAAAAVAIYLVVSGQDGRNAATRSVPTKARESAPPVVGALPPPCGTISKGTVERTIPRATRREDANSTLTTCTYSSAGAAFPWLRVEAHLYASGNTATPVKDAERYYDVQWAQAREASLVRTVTLERQRGIGDEAYRWFRADEGRPAVVGQVTARTRNAVLTVSYGERALGKAAQDRRERSCLDKATAVAREVLTALSHF